MFENFLNKQSEINEFVLSFERILKEKESLYSDIEKLKSEILIVKNRLDNKENVNLFLEELQAEAHVKRVGDFEKLLTAIVTEILPNQSPISLELEIDRGQPSLEIVSRAGDEVVEDIYRDKGGAVTNVVVLGLRMIGVVRSKMRKFLVLDEGDCWIKNDRVSTFYKVLREAADKIGLQCFVISHHDINNFDSGFSISKLLGNRNNYAFFENSPIKSVWNDDDDGIRWIHLKNFQTIKDSRLDLSPKITALTGDNDLGKSTIVRALRAVFFGECMDSLIRHYEKTCQIEIRFKDFILQFDRQRKRNPVNIWRLLDLDGNVIVKDGKKYETGSRTVPTWVKDITGIGPIGNLEIHIDKQKETASLLSQPGVVKASVLSVGQESSYIKDMIQLWKEQCSRDSSFLRDNEKKILTMIDRYEKIKDINSIFPMIEKLKSIFLEINNNNTYIDKIGNIINNYDNYITKSNISNNKISYLNSLKIFDFNKLNVDILENIKLENNLINLIQVTNNLKNINEKINLFKLIPDIHNFDILKSNFNQNILVNNFLNSIQILKNNIIIVRNKLNILNLLPQEEPKLFLVNKYISLMNDIVQQAIYMRNSRLKIKILNTIPKNDIVLFDNIKIVNIISKMEFLLNNMFNTKESIKNINIDYNNLNDEISSFVSKNKNTCPICGNHFETKDIIRCHDHE